jgi:hypothetical protein
MSSSMVILGKDFNPNKDITFLELKKNKNGKGETVGIQNSHNNKTLLIQTPKMLTWGVNRNVDDKTGEVKYSVSMQFPREQDDNYNDEMKAFLKNMKEFDALIIKSACENSRAWLGKPKLSKDMANELCTGKTVKYPKYGDKFPEKKGELIPDREPTLSGKLPFYENKFSVEIYDVKNKRLFPNANNLTPEDIIGKMDDAYMLLQCGGVWVSGGNFGVSWRIKQCILHKKSSLQGHCVIQIDEGDKAKMIAELGDGEEGEGGAAASPTSDDDDDGNKNLSEVLSGGPKLTKVKISKPESEDNDDDDDEDDDDLGLSGIKDL